MNYMAYNKYTGLTFALYPPYNPYKPYLCLSKVDTMAEDQEIRGLIPNLAERQAPLEFNQFEATALYLSATQSYTMTLDNIPAEWIIWTGPGAAGSALVYVYTEGNGLTGRRIELGASGYVRLPARGQRAISVYVATGTNVYVGLAAVSGLNTCFDIRPGI